MMIQDKIESIKDKIDIQTSLQSKRQQDTSELFKKKLRYEKLMNVTENNFVIKDDAAKTHLELKNGQIAQEQEWVNNIVEMQRNDDLFTKQKRGENINDLRQNYAQTAADRKEQAEVTIKN